MSDAATLLCVGNFDRRTGYAWNTIRGVWRAVAAALEPRGVRTLAVYRQPPRGDALLGDPPLLELAAGWRGFDDLAALCRRHGVTACWLTDAAVIGRHYGALRSAGVRFVAMHERTSGARTVPGGPKAFVKRRLSRSPAWSADRYVAISDFVRRRLVESGCVPESKVARIYNAIDVERWAAERPDPAARAELGLPVDARLVVCGCRANRYKGVDTLIEAFAGLPETDASGRPLHAVHCGDGPDLAAFRDAVRERGLSARFHLLGPRTDVARWVASADAVAVPSRWEEAFGLTVVEAMAAGKPLVASAVGAIPELVDPERSGLLVPPGDAAALGGALLRILNDPEFADKLAAAGRAEAQRRFSLPRLRDELVQLFADGMDLAR